MTEIVTIADSQRGNVPEGETTLVDEHTNQFTERHVLTLEAPEGSDHLGQLQVYRMPDFPEGVYREIVVGRESDQFRIER
jgi:hypothetical protein